MNMKFGLTQEFDCSYLPDKEEQLLVFVNDSEQCTSLQYSVLIEAGFRRSGDQVYRPHCKECNACQSIRIPVAQFTRSKSQKRILNKNQDISVVYSNVDKPEYFLIYQQYINTRHTDGSMYPASIQQYQSFVLTEWMNSEFIEFYHQNDLIGVAVTDVLPNALSALYTFFKPEWQNRSLGTFSILQQIEHAKAQNKPFLYLGYQIDECKKMNYKANFYPHERFIGNKWQLKAKKSD